MIKRLYRLLSQPVSGNVTTDVLSDALASLGYVDRPQTAVNVAKKISRMSGIEFEEFVAGVFRQQGYAVEITQATGDHGIDLMMTRGNQTTGRSV
jgi:HJR/Mrr/RecB family endonuclease